MSQRENELTNRIFDLERTIEHLRGDLKAANFKIERLTNEADNLRKALYEHERKAEQSPEHLG